MATVRDAIGAFVAGLDDGRDLTTGRWWPLTNVEEVLGDLDSDDNPCAPRVVVGVAGARGVSLEARAITKKIAARESASASHAVLSGIGAR